MTLALRYAAYSDVGCLREGNEDSAYAGPHLLAVADGMGGHAGGEIASSIAVSTLRPLDEDVPGNDMAAALEDAVNRANATLAQRVKEDPKLENMGTTLTALLWSGTRFVLIHVGDSRAYLLRDGTEFSQITHDHTLVQTLVDEGKITPEEVATHPQRSLLLRALNGQGQVDPDVRVREAQVGDRYLLCSDGLCGVVSEETIGETLATETTVEAAARRLIDLANRGGGPDNITAVVADVIDPATDPQGPTSAAMFVGAADQRREPPMKPDTPAGRAQGLNKGSNDTAEMDRIPDLESPPDSEAEPRRRKWWPMVVAFLAVVAVLGGAGYWLAQNYMNSQYYVGPDEANENVAVFQGIDNDVAGYSLAEEVENTGVRLAMLPQNERERVTATIELGSLAEAKDVVAELRTKAEACQDDPASCGIDASSGSAKDPAAPSAEGSEPAGSGQGDRPGNRTAEPGAAGNASDEPIGAP